ncbi:YDG domain-containing protein [Chelatococcus sp. SYSU_G07232]|uniref:YDG domain-containing protein n=1 Tax=Chelatococcus albus TaxID=3047466 RepID=A0ABT7ACC9_9HYPH|nr:YDG domain-containing protein [Chelatococcus sp. SYSU_G07232]MDJ1157025.1 YDG domain-containing protein [Chelatococcus sp. SYSU_G07232]
MNKVHKHIWSKTLQRLIVVPECAKGSQGKKGGRRGPAVALAATAMSTFPAWAQNVLPTGGQVVSGAATIATSGSAMTINQASDRMIANWQSFSIGAGNSVTFNQPGASSVALNRVVGQAPSQLLGSLNANGQVFLINPNGVVIGQGASVQTGGFVASTLGITNEDFLKGNYRFTGSGGAIVNQGKVSGSVVALIAPSVTNEGTISGNTALAAGTDVLLDFDGDGLLSVEVKASTVRTLVENKGLIRADGGTAILTAKGASDAMKGVVNNTGAIQARTLARKNGRILLLGDMQHGEAHVSGTLDASAPNGGNGGFIETSAKKVKVAAGARITTKAPTGQTGTWLIDPNDYTIAASGGDITGAALSAQLANTNITIQSANGATAGNGDIFVNDSVSWSANKLTLSAHRNIVVNAAMNASGTAGLALEYGQGAATAGNTATYTVNAPVNLAATGSFSTKLGSDGTVRNYTIITDVNALQNVRANISGDYVLGSDIDASATATWNSGAGFVPINGFKGGMLGFTGIFDGLGHAIHDLNIRFTDNESGLFGRVGSGGVIRNVGLIGGTITGQYDVGALVGRNDLGTISNSYSTASVAGTSAVGGLVGHNAQGTVQTSYSSGSVSASSNEAGGLIGLNVRGTVETSYATGSVSGVRFVGGLVGRNNYGTIRNSYAKGNVSASDNIYGQVGGLVGDNLGTIANSYATGDVAVNLGYYVGALVGNSYSGTVSSSFWKVQSWGARGCGSSDCGTGLTTTQMQDPFRFIDAGWDFTNIWTRSYLFDNDRHMMLRWQGGGWLYDSFVRVSGNVSKTYGGPNPSLDPVVTAAGKVSVSLGGAVSPTAGAGSSYAWTDANVLSFSGGGRTYTVIGSGGLTVTKAPLTVTANNAARTYDGQAFPGGTGVTYSGFVNGENASVLGGSLVYGGSALGAKNAGTYTITASGLSAQNYDITYLGGQLTINPAAITVSTSDVVKTYDGTTRANGAVVLASGQLFGTDALSGGTFAFADKNAGTNKTVRVSGVTVSDGNNGNNYVVSYADNTTSTINPAAITVSTADVVRTYEGNNTTTPFGSGMTTNLGRPVAVSGQLYGTDSLSGGIYAFTDKNAGTNKSVTVSNVTVNDGNGGNNYIVTYADNTTSTINKAPLEVAVHAPSKTYDGQAFSGGSILTYGLMPGDDVSVLGTPVFGGTAQSATNAGTYTVTAFGFSPQNYYIFSNRSGTLTINKAPLTVTLGSDARTYNGQAYSGGNGWTIGGFVNGENASVLGGSLVYGGSAQGAKNAGTYTIAASGLTAQNYDITYVSGQLTIDKAALTVTANDAARTYDGQAFSGGNGVRYSGFVNGENASVLGGSLVYGGTSQGARNAGTYTLTASGLTSQNYNITYLDGTLTTSKAPLTVTANNAARTYDGQAFPGGTGVTYSGFVNGENASVLGGSLVYGGSALGAKNAGTYTITASGLSAQNYDITYLGGQLTINPAAITVSTSDVVKTYDGTTRANGAVVLASGQLFGTDALSGGTFAFADKNAGTNKTVRVSGVTVSDGNNGNNYVVSYADNTTSTINRAVISTITGISADKTYDGTTAATLNTVGAVFNGMAAGDHLTVASGTGAFSDKNAGAGKRVTITGLSLGGADAGNYVLASTTATTTAEIARATAALSGFTAASKTYDGTTAATLINAGTLIGVHSGDSVSFTHGAATFSDKNAGTNKTVTLNGVTLTGTDAGNYMLASPATTTADIARAVITGISGITANSKSYDGTTLAKLNTVGALFSGVFPGDNLSIASAVGRFADANPGQNKRVDITSIVLGGPDAGNYRLSGTMGLTATADINTVIAPPLTPLQIRSASLTDDDPDALARGMFTLPVHDLLAANDVVIDLGAVTGPTP